MKKDIPGYEGLYAATTDGKIWSYEKKWWGGGGKSKAFVKRTARFLKFRKDRDGYLRVELNVKSRNLAKTYGVHRLVAQTFVPNPHNKPQINHKNGIKTDNRVGNLEWCTIPENIRHSIENGLNARGIKNGSHKLTENQVRQIRKRYKDGDTLSGLGREYRVTPQTIWAIVNNRIWKHL